VAELLGRRKSERRTAVDAPAGYRKRIWQAACVE
jgi:hypothetical protein